jgi:hypothetical protein
MASAARVASHVEICDGNAPRACLPREVGPVVRLQMLRVEVVGLMVGSDGAIQGLDRRGFGQIRDLTTPAENLVSKPALSASGQCSGSSRGWHFGSGSGPHQKQATQHDAGGMGMAGTGPCGRAGIWRAQQPPPLAG